LLRARLNRFIDLTELMNQNVLAEHFCPHNSKEVRELCDDWANLRLWWKPPKREFEDRIKEYFGAEVAWLFVWQRYFIVALVVPALLSVPIFFRRFVLDLQHQRMLQIAFGIFMTMWATAFNRMYYRYEATVSQRWDVDKVQACDQPREQHSQELEGGWRQRCGMILGDVLAIGMVVISVIGIRLIQGLRETLMASHSSFVWQQAGAILVSMQILVLDKVWCKLSKVLVDQENHKTSVQWQRSWVQKVFLVRMFNNLYPFLYIGFVKQFSYQGCPGTQTGCLDELQRYLLTYFVSRLLIHLGTDLSYVVVARFQLHWEMRRCSIEEAECLHLQIQAKAQEHDEKVLMDDWTEQTLTFIHLTCFNIVLPVIALLALLMTLVEARCLAHRNCCFLRRPVPRSAPGIGEWHRVLEGAEFVAVLVNLSLGIFAMQPLNELPPSNKLLIFVVAEHVILFFKYLVTLKFPPMPCDVEDAECINEDFLRRTTAIFHLHKAPLRRISTRVMSGPLDVGPSAFGGRRPSKDFEK